MTNNEVMKRMVDKTTCIFLFNNINHKLNGQMGIVDFNR